MSQAIAWRKVMWSGVICAWSIEFGFNKSNIFDGVLKID